LKRILLDTGILSDYINKRRGVFERVREYTVKGIRVGTCVPVLAELAAGIEASSSREKNMAPFLGALEAIVVWPFDQSAAFKYGQIFAEQRRKGRPMQ